MEITYSGLSSAGPVRANNEDSLAAWTPSTAEEYRTRGAVAILADGVGGHGHGEVASQLACEHALRAFAEAKPNATPAALLWQMFNAANLAVYDAGMRHRGDGGEGRMLTTLTISIFRNNEVTIGHVGDCRTFVVQGGRARRLTSDHSYAGVQVKLGLATVQEAMNSPLRSVLTRAVGQDPMIRLDQHVAVVNRGDYVVQCTDGLWCFVTEAEVHDTVVKHSPEEACRLLIELALKRGSDDNLTVQVVRIDGVERLTYYRGLPTYRKVEAATMGSDPEVGQLLDDRYQITDLVSRSGMASIFKATDLTTGRTVALKVPFLQFESDPAFFSRFQREAQIGRTLNHPYVLRFEDAPAEQSRPYIVMEYLEGQTLGHLMRSVRPMPESDALRIASRVCEALHYMHDHDVVHRDLKPENIMICNDGSIRIMDFGIAKYEGMRRLTFGGFSPAMGTPDYMAPEQVRGRRGDRRTDVYALGAMLYEMLTGTVPFEGANPFLIMNARLSGDPVAPRQRNAVISPAVEEIVLHAMARDPNDRYATALEMKQDLDHPSEVRLTGRALRLVAPRAWRGRWRGARLGALVAGVPAVVALVVYLLHHVRWE